MDLDNEVVKFLDAINVGVDILDYRLECLMEKNELTLEQLQVFLRLLQYKKRMTVNEDIGYDNTPAYNLIVNLLRNVDETNVDVICSIIQIVLMLDPSTMSSKSEQLLLQILPEIAFIKHIYEPEKCYSKPLLYLKICDAILEAVIKGTVTVRVEFINFENILKNANERLKIHFVSHTVPLLYEADIRRDILDSLWNYVKLSKDISVDFALKIITSLINYYLPLFNNRYSRLTTYCILQEYFFWDLILEGFQLIDPLCRKLAIYITKRAIDCVISLGENVTVSRDGFRIFVWVVENELILKTTWNCFFIVMHNLEEKQSNTYLPSLRLFDVLKPLGNHWLGAAFKMGLRHDNPQVRNKCIEYRLQIRMETECEVQQLLEALNDINLFDCPRESDELTNKLTDVFMENNTFISFLQAIPSIRWSPIPFYNITVVLSKIKIQALSAVIDRHSFVNKINAIINIPCNNILIRKAAEMNIACFLVKYCNEFNWTTYTELCSIFSHSDIFSLNTLEDNPIRTLVKNLKLKETEKMALFDFISQSCDNIDFGILYLDCHELDLPIFIGIIKKKVNTIRSILSNPNCNLHESFKDLVYLFHLLSKTEGKHYKLIGCINNYILSDYTTIVLYLLALLITETGLCWEEMVLLFKNKFNTAILIDDVVVILLQLFHHTILLLNDKKGSFDKKKLSISIINNLIIDYLDKNDKLLEYFNKHFEFNTIINIQKHFESTSRQTNTFCEQTCELVYKLLKRSIPCNVKDIVFFMKEVLEHGSCDCLKFLLMIGKEILPKLIIWKSDTEFDLSIFLNRIWKKLEEIKSNTQYIICMEYFINIITSEDLLNYPKHLNITAPHYKNIVNLAPGRNAPLFSLIGRLCFIVDPPECLMTIISNILLYNPIPSKYQRLTENLEAMLMRNPTCGMENKILIENLETMLLRSPTWGLEKKICHLHHEYQIQYVAALTFCSANAKTKEKLVMCLKNAVDDILKRKKTYHSNSRSHRILFRAFQHLLMAMIECRFKDDTLLNWYIETLGRCPHQPSVRICLEWCITLCIYVKNVPITEDMLKDLQSWNIPSESQLTILYWLFKHKLFLLRCTKEEFILGMDTVLSHTMAPSFKIRLQAQYYASKLYEMSKISTAEEYVSTMNIIEKIFAECSTDKNFITMKEDYFTNRFDIVGNLTPFFVYEILPQYDNAIENVKGFQFITIIMTHIDIQLDKIDNDDFKKEWFCLSEPDENFLGLVFKHEQEEEALDIPLPSLDKYTPRSHIVDEVLHDIGVKKTENKSNLILVASLMDELPNLDGMVGTSEMFGVKTLVVGSLRHLEDKLFHGLSASAKKWIQIEEVQPGAQLKHYLRNMKANGYFLIAAAQSSTTCELYNFKFPKNSLLLLGHEKDGIPCDLLPLMDHCVEISQVGRVGSLNAPVTAAIFTWEYTKQNL